ncbi:MAG: SIMPL domain-containing protein [Pseudomonadales bacterium]
MRVLQLFLSSLILIPAAALAGADDGGLHVTGSGEIRAVPDMGYVNIDVRREGADAAALKTELDQVTAAILALTRSLKIDKRDVTAAAVSIYPRYRRQDDENVVDGVIASRSVQVTVRDLDRIAEVINGALAAGANGIGNVQLDLSKRTDLEREALNLAIDDARREAAQIAERFGVELGRLQSASSSAQQPVPVYKEAMMMRAAAADDSFSPGEMTVRREVQATFAIAE